MTYYGKNFHVVFHSDGIRVVADVHLQTNPSNMPDLRIIRRSEAAVFEALRQIPEVRADFTYPCWDRLTWLRKGREEAMSDSEAAEAVWVQAWGRCTKEAAQTPHDLLCAVCGVELNNQCLDPACMQDDAHTNGDAYYTECQPTGIGSTTR